MIPLKSIQMNNLRFVIDKLKERPTKGAESYVMEKLEGLGIKVKRSGQVNGFPDFTCNYKGKRFYVEVKGWNDSLRISQMDWIKRHPKSLVYVYCLKKDWEDYWTKLNRTKKARKR